MMNGQLNLFDQIEQEDREEKYRQYIRESYREWLHAPNETPLVEPYIGYNPNIYKEMEHRCDTMPAYAKLWINDLASRRHKYFCVLEDTPGSIAGKRVTVCPYCGANVEHGDGGWFLAKSECKYFFDESYRRYYGLDEIDKEEGL